MESKTQKSDYLEQDIIMAQNKLSNIMIAQNQEKLHLEKLEEDVIVLAKSNETGISKLDKLLSDIKEEENRFSVLKDQYFVDTQKIKADKSKLEQQIHVLDNDIEEQKKLHLELSDENVIYKEKIELDKQKQSALIDSVQQYKISLDQENEIIKWENADLLAQKKKLGEEIVTIKKSIIQEKKLLIETSNQVPVIQKQVAELLETVTSIKEKIANKNKSIETLGLMVVEMELTKTQLQNDISILELDKKSRIEKKFQLQVDIQALNQREEFIKEKYQIAGMPY